MNENTVMICGRFAGNFTFSHESYHEKYYKNTIEVKRKSGVIDYIPVIMSQFIAESSDEWEGVYAEVHGEWRSVGIYDGNHRRCITNLFIKEIFPDYEFDKEDGWVNNIVIEGEIINDPSAFFRTTKNGNELCDFKIKAERSNGKIDIIHCIAWNRIARIIAHRGKGSKVWLKGRIQSREFTRNCNGIKEVRTVHEVSVIHVIFEDEIIAEGLD